ncbi:MAG: hypothetical protein JWP97_4934 [Labilithrix sp.]|nr:hypothetical protein [Labilithrix sp.]
MMRRPLALACLAVALASVPALPSVARADDVAVAEAKARFDEGLDLADAGKHEAARLKFQQAYSVFKAPAVLYNLARTEQLTGHELEALDHFRLFLRVGNTDSKITDAMRDKARQNASELARKVGQVEIDAPVSSRVSIDGKPLEDAPKEPVAVAPGKHTIEATFQGRVKSVSVECAAGNVTKARIVFEDGSFTEPPGERDHRSSWTAARVATVSGLGAVAVTGVVLGVVFRSAAQSNVDDAQTALHGQGCIGSGSPECARAATLKDDRDSNVTLSTVSFLAGGVFAAGAVATAIWWPKRSREVARVVPMMAPGYAGASFAGSF